MIRDVMIGSMVFLGPGMITNVYRIDQLSFSHLPVVLIRRSKRIYIALYVLSNQRRVHVLHVVFIPTYLFVSLGPVSRSFS